MAQRRSCSLDYKKIIRLFFNSVKIPVRSERKMKSTQPLTLVFLLVVFGAVCAFADTGGFDRTLQVSGPVDMDITSGSGNITVHTGAAGSVHVKATIKAQNSW